MNKLLEKQCIICGDTFVANIYNRSVCYKDHHHPCPVCGKDVVCNDPRRQNCTCSRKCGHVQSSRTNVESCLKKYGVTNAAKIPEVRETISKKLSEIHPKQPTQYKNCEICGQVFELHWPYTQHTCSSKCRGEYRKRAGVSKAVYQKACLTNLSKYGVANQGERPEIHTKMEDTMEDRYGVRYARYLPEIEEKVKKTCLERYGVPYYIQTEDANRHNVYRISKLNRDFSSFLASYQIVSEFEKYICGKFYDIIVEDIHTVLEIDPTYTHTSAGNHWCASGMKPEYHLNKTILAIENGYRCIHVFDWDSWDAIVELIRPKSRIYARNCVVRQIDKETAEEFTNLYHISGSCKGQLHNFGLYYDGELVEAMTFGKPRYTSKYTWELLRLCTKSGLQVVGGASKLFTAFVKSDVFNDGDSIISYCDRSKFTGQVYLNIGMKLDHITSPNLIWSKDNKKITNNLLLQRGFDQLFGTDYGKGTSNEQLMIESGWLPVYDCGQLVYLYK